MAAPAAAPVASMAIDKKTARIKIPRSKTDISMSNFQVKVVLTAQGGQADPDSLKTAIGSKHLTGNETGFF